MENDCGSGFYYVDFMNDFLFFIDCILNFFSAYVDQEENIIKGRKVKFFFKFSKLF